MQLHIDHSWQTFDLFLVSGRHCYFQGPPTYALPGDPHAPTRPTTWTGRAWRSTVMTTKKPVANMPVNVAAGLTAPANFAPDKAIERQRLLR
jgi:hypothetical protein